MFFVNRNVDPAVHDAAIRMARRCRFLIQACLREEEWGDADREFYLIICDELERFVAKRSAAGGRPVA
jgi:hypothetical protein